MAADTSRSQVISLIRDLFYSINITISAILREARSKRGLFADLAVRCRNSI